ncbi:MAG: hypothetical protein JJE21_02910 [Spirochaetaceae bacterium]|nr:hypothetical protein [Spirochaetaceae bacterium]
MALFLDSLGLSKVKDNQAEVLNLFTDVKRESGQDYDYKKVEYKNGLSLIARIAKEGTDLDIIGVDSHISNSSVWKAKPVMSLGQTAELPAVVFSSLDGKSAFIVNVIEAGLSNAVLKENESIKLQVCGFPAQMAVYNDREDYEDKTEAPYMTDKMLFPYYFFNLQSGDIDEEQRKLYSENILFNIYSGEVLETEKVQYLDNSEYCYYSKVKTELGNLQLIYSSNIVASPVKKGNYVVGSVYISAKVLK